MFRLVQGRPRVLPGPLQVTLVPGVRDVVLSEDGAQHRLASLLGGGGEGKVFLTNTGLACKVYDRGRLTEGLKAKLQLMRMAQFAHAGLCWPKNLVVNARGEFVGYLMDRAQGKEIQKCVFIKPLLLERFPDWDRRNLVNLAISVLEIIQVLHSENVLLGDINPLNVLIDDQERIYFVDTDSYQIEDFPCPVGTPTFLAPELAGQQLSEVLRTPAHESFAVSTLVFMLLMPGKPPYSHAGGTDPTQNVRKRHFPYNLGEKRGIDVPAGPWRFIWSHFPYRLKEKFQAVFAGQDRPEIPEWLKILDCYRYDLDAGHVSAEIFPTGFKQLDQQQVEAKGGKWLQCMNRTCPNGGYYGEFREQDSQQIRLCPTCRNLVWTKPRCVDCSREFTIKLGEKAYLENRGLEPPKRCAGCRETRRQRSRY
jgi:DNA-binding helix-hairpin-helix protein with protein kinase domain